MSIDLLRRAQVELGREVRPVLRWLADGIAAYLRGAADGLTLERALGLTAPGRDAWWTGDARRARDDAVRRLRDEHFAGCSTAEAARQIASGRRLNGWRSEIKRATGLAVPGPRRLVDILAEDIADSGSLLSNARPGRRRLIARRDDGVRAQP